MINFTYFPQPFFDTYYILWFPTILSPCPNRQTAGTWSAQKAPFHSPGRSAFRRPVESSEPRAKRIAAEPAIGGKIVQNDHRRHGGESRQ